MGHRLAVGDKLPPFELPDQSGKIVKLTDLLGVGSLVFFFYPADETLVCTREACGFRDSHVEFNKASARIFGVSGDSVASHASFAANHQLPYTLLADTGDIVRNDIFGVPRGLLGVVAGRATYVVDKNGIVRHVFKSLLQAQAHVDEALATVRQLAAG